MARVKTASALKPKPAKDRPEPVAPIVAPIARLTAVTQAILTRFNGGDARIRVELGGVLREVRGRLPHGQWLDWLDATVPSTHRAAQNYIELAKWAEASPMLERVAPLGASKVFLISRVPQPIAERLLASPTHVVPGTRRKTTLSLMKYPEFLKVILRASRPQPPEQDPMVVLVRDARSSVKKTIKLLKLLSANKQAVDEDVAKALHKDLTKALQALSKAFRLA